MRNWWKRCKSSLVWMLRRSRGKEEEKYWQYVLAEGVDKEGTYTVPLSTAFLSIGRFLVDPP